MLQEIGRASTSAGRSSGLIGKAQSASVGTISQGDIVNRPIARPGEVLEAIPGVIVTQHSGEGKANQYYLRGFQLDHGTDLSATIVGEPINFPTHAHGQGYSDINWLLPEMVSFVEFKKGPYYADEGDFSTAGSYNLFYRNTIPNTVELSGGSNGFGRIFLAGSPSAGTGHFLYALEAYHDDGTFDRPDNYRRFNGVLRYSRATDKEDFNVTALGYSGIFDSSDQISQRLVDAGVLDRFRTDPSGIGTGVPESLASVASVGVTVDRPAYTAALRFRYFGPRILIEDGSAQTRPTELVNAQFAAKLSRKSRLTFDVYNLLGANADDTTYFYNSWTRQDGANPALASDPAVNPALGGAGVADYHVHSTPKRTFRVALTTGL